MKHTLILLLMVVISATGGCVGEETPKNPTMSFTAVPIALSTDYNQTIESAGTKIYIFTTNAVNTDYQISLLQTDLVADFGWYLTKFDSSYVTVTNLVDNELFSQDDVTGPADEVAVVTGLDLSTKYYLRVEEWAFEAGSYTIRVTPQ